MESKKIIIDCERLHIFCTIRPFRSCRVVAKEDGSDKICPVCYGSGRKATVSCQDCGAGGEPKRR